MLCILLEKNDRMTKIDLKDAHLWLRIAERTHETVRIQVEQYTVPISGVLFRVSIGTGNFHRNSETNKKDSSKTKLSTPDLS